MPAKESGKGKGIDLIEKGYDRARSIQKPFNVNESELKLIQSHMKVTGFVNFREYVMHQIRFCARYDKLEAALEERFDKFFEGKEKEDLGGIDPTLHPEIVKELKKLTIEAISQFHIMRALLQRPRQTYEELKRGVEAFLSLAGHEFDEKTFQNQLIVLIAQNIVSYHEEFQPETYSLVVIEDLLQKLTTTLHPE